MIYPATGRKRVRITMRKRDKVESGRSLNLKFVIFLYILMVTVHFLLQLYPKRLVVYQDEPLNYNIAKSLYMFGLEGFRHTGVFHKSVLYSFLISPFFAIADANTRMMATELFLCFFMYSAIFPCYLLGKKYLNSKRTQLIFLLVCMTVPEFMMVRTIMSEPVYYPVALWIVLYLCGLLEENDFKRKCNKGIITGILLYLAYWIKSISFACLVPVVLFFIAAGVFRKKGEKKQDIVVSLLICTSFVVVKIFVEHTILYAMPDNVGYPLQRYVQDAFVSTYSILFYFYCLIYNFMGMMLAYFILPVLLPFVCWKKLEDIDKKIFVLMSFIALFHIGVISVICSVRENLGWQSIPIHLRYYAYLFVPFLLLFFRCIETKKLMEIREETGKNSLLLPMISFLLIFLTVFNGVGHTVVNGNALQFWSSRIYEHGYLLTGGTGEIAFNLTMLAAKLGIAIMLFLGLFFLSHSRIKKQLIFFAVLFLGLNIVRNVSIHQFYGEAYRISDAQVDQILKLQEVIDTLGEDAKYMYVFRDDTERTILDKYISPMTFFDIYFFDRNTIINNSDGEGTSVLQINLVPTDYVIVKSMRVVEDENLVRIPCDQLTEYRIYSRKNDASIGVYTERFPQNTGESVGLSCTDDILMTHYTQGEKGFVSEDFDGALAFGPYWEITAGTYRVEFTYSTDEKLQSVVEPIGYVDVTVPDLGDVLATAPVYAGQNVVSLEFTAVSDAKNAETRFFTDRAGIVLEHVTITRLD